ncbi:hypothetical protein Syncc8109_2077 [Synechococcus sp. WH 8109]|jgi:hypothetical protein|nr:hypothetical protein Syncc8109_2077 [Synechococcus sp. WH 8109]
MAQRRFFSSPLDQQRDQLDLCWQLDCDIDPLILRARFLHRRGEVNWAVGLEQEVLPIV